MKKVLLYALIAMLSFGCEKPEEPKIVNPDTPSVTPEDPNKKPDQPNEDPNKNPEDKPNENPDDNKTEDPNKNPGDKPNEDPNNNNTEDPNKTEEQPEEKVEEKKPDPSIHWDEIDAVTDYELSADGFTLVKWNNRHTRNLDMSKDPALAKVTKIGYSAFDYAAALENIFISNKVTVIGNTAFEGRKNLKTVVMPNTVATIEYGAFAECYNLEKVDFSTSLTTIERKAFEGCGEDETTGLKSIILPKSLTNIGEGAFNSCYALTSVEINSTNITFGVNVFSYSTELRTITIRATTVPTYGENMLSTDNLQKIYVPADLVESYKTAAGWSEFADKFEAIKK